MKDSEFIKSRMTELKLLKVFNGFATYKTLSTRLSLNDQRFFAKIFASSMTQAGVLDVRANKATRGGLGESIMQRFGYQYLLSDAYRFTA